MTHRTSHLYDEIESRYGFSLPMEYRTMQERGWFDWSSEAYLWFNDMEWMPLEAIRDHEFPEYCHPGYVPFAFTAGEDHWCWHPASANDGVTPVVRCPHDSKIGEFYAPHFLGALYRHAMEFAVSVEPNEERDARAHLKRWAHDVGPLLPALWRETLASVAAAPLQTEELIWHGRRYVLTGLVRQEAFMEIVQRDLDFPMLDMEFQWMED